MPVTYREMLVADLPAVFELRVATRENAITLEELEQDYGITPASLAEAMAADVKGWLCEEKGLVVGFAMGDRSNGEIQVVAVRPGFEDRGIGKQLLGFVQRWLHQEGHDEVWLLSNPDSGIRAHGFYRKLGWQPTGERRGDDEVLRRRAGPEDQVAPRGEE